MSIDETDRELEEAMSLLNDRAGLYPSILFHMTDRKGLLGLLANNFRVSYSRERIVDKNNKVDEFGAPMVSFCDLRISELRKHMKNYGYYGIGMSKEWANANGLNTVYYINSHAELTEGISTSTKLLFEHIKGIQDYAVSVKMNKVYMDLLNVYRFMKNYEGELWRHGELIDKNYRFANEREWRFVPPLDGALEPFVGKDIMDDPDRKARANGRLDGILYFEPKDIRYILVAWDYERDEIIRHIQDVKDKYGDEEVQRLKSRIISAEQILIDV